MRRPLVALLVLVCGWAVVPAARACLSLYAAGRLQTMTPETAVITGRVVRFVSIPNLHGTPRDPVETVLRWHPDQETYTGNEGREANLVWGVEIETLRTYTGTLPHRVRVYLYSEDCYWTPASKSYVMRTYRPGGEVGIVVYENPSWDEGDADVPRDVYLSQNFSGAITTRPYQYERYGPSSPDVYALNRQLRMDIHGLWPHSETVAQKRSRMDSINTSNRGYWAGVTYEDRVISAVAFEMGRTLARVVNPEGSQEQRAESLVRLWALHQGYDVRGDLKRRPKCSIMEFISKVLPDSAAQAHFAAGLREARLPPYRYVGMTPATVGCKSPWRWG